MDARELAIRRNQTHRMLVQVDDRLKFVDRDIRRAGNDFERDRLELVRRELDRWRSALRSELSRLKDSRATEDYTEG
jgi:hypothetical protein